MRDHVQPGTERIVVDDAAALRAAELLSPGAPHKPLRDDAGEAAIARLDRLRTAQGTRPVSEIRLDMQRTMQNFLTVFRTAEILAEAGL